MTSEQYEGLIESINSLSSNVESLNGISVVNIISILLTLITVLISVYAVCTSIKANEKAHESNRIAMDSNFNEFYRALECLSLELRFIQYSFADNDITKEFVIDSYEKYLELVDGYNDRNINMPHKSRRFFKDLGDKIGNHQMGYKNTNHEFSPSNLRKEEKHFYDRIIAFINEQKLN